DFNRGLILVVVIRAKSDSVWNQLQMCINCVGRSGIAGGTKCFAVCRFPDVFSRPIYEQTLECNFNRFFVWSVQIGPIVRGIAYPDKQLTARSPKDAVVLRGFNTVHDFR